MIMSYSNNFLNNDERGVYFKSIPEGITNKERSTHWVIYPLPMGKVIIKSLKDFKNLTLKIDQNGIGWA